MLRVYSREKDAEKKLSVIKTMKGGMNMNHRISRIVFPILMVSTLVCIPSYRGTEGSAGG